MQQVRILGWCWLAILAAVLVPAIGADKTKARVVVPIQATNYLGGEPAYILTGSALRALIVPAWGGRLVEYSLNSENVLAESTSLPNSASNGGLRFGYECSLEPWTIASGSQPEEPGHCDAAPFANLGLRVKRENSKRPGLLLEQEFIVEPESGDLGIAQRVRNRTKTETPVSISDRTWCKGGGFAFFPLKKKSRFPAGWALQKKTDNQVVYDGAHPQAPTVRIIDGMLVAKCEGESTVLGADSAAGWIAYVRGKWLLTKYFPAQSRGRSASSTPFVELAFDEQIAGLQLRSPEIKLKPGDSYVFPEKWTLVELDDRVTSFDEVRALAKKVSESPFD